jgi:hypothetical protein
MVHSFRLGRLGSKTSDRSASGTNFGCILAMRPRLCFHSFRVVTDYFGEKHVFRYIYIYVYIMYIYIYIMKQNHLDSIDG